MPKIQGLSRIALATVLLVVLVVWIRVCRGPDSAGLIGAVREQETLQSAEAPTVADRSPTAENLGAPAIGRQSSANRIWVRSATDLTPVANALVYHVDSEGAGVCRGVTGSDGLLVTPRIETGELLIQAAGFADRTEGLFDRTEDDILIHLTPGGSLSGVVTLDGQPAMGVDVIAWQIGYVTEPTILISRARGADPRVSWATTDKDGLFEIDGLSSEIEYNLFAGGQGFFGELRRLRPTKRGLVLNLSHAYVVKLRLEDSSTGGAALIPRRLNSTTALTLEPKFSTPDVKFVVGALEFNSPNLAANVDVHGQSTYVFQAVSSQGLAQLGPFWYRIELPGYERASGEVFAERASSAEIVGQTIQLKSISNCRGAVECRTDEAQTRSGGAGGVGGVSLNLRSLTRPDAYSFSLQLSQDVNSFDGIPCGDYEVSLSGTAPVFRLPPGVGVTQYVAIESAGSSVGLNLSRFGAINLSISDVRGDAYTGPVGIVTINESTGRRERGFVSIERAPYVLPLVPDGRYTVWVQLPRSICTVPESSVVEVVDGAICQMQFRLL